MPRAKKGDDNPQDARALGAALRGLRRGAGHRAVQDAAASPGCPAARQTIYAYERGGLVPSLRQFLDLVEFYATKPGKLPTKPPEDLRAQAVAAIMQALALRTYHVRDAFELMERLQPSVEHRRSAKR